MKNLLFFLTITFISPITANEGATATTASSQATNTPKTWKATGSLTLPDALFTKVTPSPDGKTIIIATEDYQQMIFLRAHNLKQIAQLTRSQEKHIVKTKNEKEFKVTFFTSSFNGSAPETRVTIADDKNKEVTFHNDQEISTQGDRIKLSHYGNFIQLLTPKSLGPVSLNNGDDSLVNKNTRIALSPNEKFVISFGNCKMQVWPMSNKDIQPMEDKKSAQAIRCKAIALAFASNRTFVTLSRTKRTKDSEKRDTFVTIFKKTAD